MPIEKWSENVVVVHLGDDPQFSEDLRMLEHASSYVRPDTVLDFSAVRYVNSSNLAALLKLRKRSQADNAKLVLCSVQNEVWTTFLVTGLDLVFEVSSDVTTALATVQMNAPRT
jgi:anti-anti-sigma factor